MARRPLNWPWAGRSDEQAEADQAPLSTRSAKNVRNRDPVTGRIRGASRSGQVKFNASPIGSGRIKALVSTAVDTRKVDFDFTPGSESVAWASTTPSKTDCLNGKTDSQGNVYALDGPAGIVKYNSAGRELMKIALPVADPSHVVRALWVDEADRIFAGVSAGGDVRTARVFCIIQLQDNEYVVLWQIEPGAYTEELRVYRGSQLWAAHNYPTDRRARVLVYEAIGVFPVETKRIESVAYPINGFDLSATGEPYCASGSGSAIPLSPGWHRLGFGNFFTPPLVGWTPRDDSTLNIWSWFDSSDADSLGEADLEQTAAVAEIKDGQQVIRWRDKSGNGRDWFAGTLIDTGEKGPEYVSRGIGGLPCIRFDNGRVPTVTKHSLVSLANASIDVNLADQQRTPIPAYTTGMWCMFIVLRPSPDLDTVPIPRTILAMDNEVAGSSDHVLFHNRNAQAGPTPGAATAGFISYYADTDTTGDGGAGAGGQSRGFDWLADADAGSTTKHQTGAVIVTVLCDGGVEPNDTTKTRCVVKYNGKIVDRFEGEGFATLKEMWLGYAPTGVVASGTDPLRRFRGEIAEMIVIDRRDRTSLTEPKVLTHDQLEPGIAPNSAQTDNQITRIEGYLAYKWGIGTAMVQANGVDLRLTHPYGRNAAGTILGPPKPIVGGAFIYHEAMLLTTNVLTKHNTQGVLQWLDANITAIHAGTRGAIGYGVRVRKIESDGKTHVWGTGPVDDPFGGAGSAAVRKIIDNGSTFSIVAGDGAWIHQFTALRGPDYEHPRMDADEFGNLYYPYFETGAAAEWSLLVFKKDGVAGAAVVLVDFLLSASQQAHAVALPPDALNPDYRGELTTEMAEFVYIFTRNESTAANATVHKLLMVNTLGLATGSPREIVTLAAVEDDIRRITASTNVIPTGGSAAFDSTSQYVQMLRAGEDIVILDGSKYLAYALREGTIAPLVSTSAGEIPPRARYMMFWRHRLVLALEGGKYAASRLGNIRDWNLNPGSNIAGVPLQTSTQAFTGTIVRAGEAEDSLVTMIPVVDDLAFLVGESKILRLTGDPQDGGNIHLCTDSMGGVFGDSWCKDAAGRVFMWGNKPPGLYLLPPTGEPRSLTEDSLEDTEFLEELDMVLNRIVLAWDPIDRGVHIYQVAWATSVVVTHWFWEENAHKAVKVPPIWADRINSADKQPTAVAYLGGDDTSGLLLGCADGYVRMYSPTARDDDGTAIDSFVVIELSHGVPEGQAARVREISLDLASDQEGCRLELFASETGDDIGTILDSFDLKPGRNRIKTSVKGAHIWARLRNAKTGRWAFEDASCWIEPAGRVKMRLT